MVLTKEEKKMIMSEVVGIIAEVLFDNHLYTFGGKTFKQKSGGPIGLRATCAIARLIMCSWDRAWMAKMVEGKVKINEYLRYMDDGRSFMPPFKHGWRWRSGNLVYTRTWEKSDLD